MRPHKYPVPREHVREAIFAQNMDFLTAENDCKWGFAEPEYYGCTKTLEFAESCNMDYR